MTETTPKSSRRFFLPVVIAIIAIGVIGYFTSKAGLDKALVKEAVDTFAEDLKASSNDTLVFTYKDITIAGSFTDRHAIITSPVLVQSPEGLESEDKVSYTTDAVLLHPESRDLSALRVELPHPIKGYKGAVENNSPMITLIQKSPIEMQVDSTSRNSQPFIKTQITLPDSMLIDGPESERGKPWNQFSIGMKAGAFITNTRSAAKDSGNGEGSTEIDIRNVVLTPFENPTHAISIENIISNYTNNVSEKGSSSISFTADIGKITGSDEVLPYGPIGLVIDISYDGLLSSAPEDFASNNGQEKAIKVKTFNLTTRDAALYASADFVSGAKDVLPVGTANINIENAPFIIAELRKHKVINASNEFLADAMVMQITGKKLAESKDINIDITRVRDGAFQIGKTTFEELMALVLREALKPHNAEAKQSPNLKVPMAPLPESQKQKVEQ